MKTKKATEVKGNLHISRPNKSSELSKMKNSKEEIKNSKDNLQRPTEDDVKKFLKELYYNNIISAENKFCIEKIRVKNLFSKFCEKNKLLFRSVSKKQYKWIFIFRDIVFQVESSIRKLYCIDTCFDCKYFFFIEKRLENILKTNEDLKKSQRNECFQNLDSFKDSETPLETQKLRSKDFTKPSKEDLIKFLKELYDNKKLSVGNNFKINLKEMKQLFLIFLKNNKLCCSKVSRNIYEVFFNLLNNFNLFCSYSNCLKDLE